MVLFDLVKNKVELGFFCSGLSCRHRKPAVKNHNSVPSSSKVLLVVSGDCVLPRLLVGERLLH